jgi:hypothetical protein
VRHGNALKRAAMDRVARRPLPFRFAWAILSLALANAVGFAQQEKNPKSTATPKSETRQTPTASPAPSPTPETTIDALTEAELLLVEDRFVNAIENSDAKELEELLHPQFADAIKGRESAITKRGFIARVSNGSVATYRVEKERKLTRSGNLFTVEGLARDMSHDGWESRPEEWVHVRRLWEKQSTRWLATAQIINPAQERDPGKETQPPKEKRSEPK